METEIRLTKLAACAGCGAKLGAGTLASMLEGFKTHSDPRLIVGYDKSDDASVYVLDEQTALIQTTDFFPPIVDDPYLYGRIAAVNALSDVYAMGGEPKLALNILCVREDMSDDTVKQACSIVSIYMCLLIFAAIMIVSLEAVTFSEAVFEVASAIGTVGLSTGITPNVGLISKTVLALLMFVGRIGGYSFVLVFATEKANPDMERPVEKVLVG